MLRRLANGVQYVFTEQKVVCCHGNALNIIMFKSLQVLRFYGEVFNVKKEAISYVLCLFKMAKHLVGF